MDDDFDEGFPARPLPTRKELINRLLRDNPLFDCVDVLNGNLLPLTQMTEEIKKDYITGYWILVRQARLERVLFSW